MTTQSLHGREHIEIGKIETRHTAHAAITLSVGGAAKIYPHTDPNEDSAAFAEGDAGILLVVADGHSGHAAAECAVDFLIEHCAPKWLAEKSPVESTPSPTPRPRGYFQESAWTPIFLETLIRINEAITAIPAKRSGERGSRTTLTFAVIRPQDNLFAYASIGDSHLFRIAHKSAIDVVCQHSPSGRHFFLGMPTKEARQMSQFCVTGELPLEGVQAIALVTDGLSERGIGVASPESAVLEAAKRAMDVVTPERVLAMTRALTETANAAHRTNASGDNMACAVAWLDF